MGKPVEKKRKKKGRPSLLDLQKRSLRLQKQEQQEQQQEKRNPNPSPNPYIRFPNTGGSRRITRRNPGPEAEEDDDEDEDEDSSGKRREKKLKLVLRLPNRSTNSPRDSAPSGSESDGEGEETLRKRKIDTVGSDGDREKAKKHNSSKGTDPLQGESSDSGPTTPLPDKKLLVFILDRLQKKDTYSVFSDPVDPNELPDYHDIIEHPMDFGTVRKKLSRGAYANLEEFEKDVFLISLNAMRYNAPDTIYFRQARSIHELAKKDFENLRQESDDNEPEPKTVVRRGRPPSKNIKRAVGRPPADRAASDFSSDATLANAGDMSHWSTSNLLRKGLASDRTGMADVSTRTSYGLRNTETFSWMGVHKSEINEEYSGSGQRGISTKYGKKLPVSDENRRNTYKQSQSSTCVREPSVLTTFDGDKKQLLPIGLHMEHAYARSLARFASNLGPIGWAIAAKRIERVLPPGTNFGRGWVGDAEAPLQSHLPLLSTSPPLPSQPKITSTSCTTTTIPRSDELPERPELPSNDRPVEGGHFSTTPPPVSSSVANDRSSNSMEGGETARALNYEGGLNLMGTAGGGGSIQSKTPFQLHQNPGMQPTVNGYNSSAFGFTLPSQGGKLARPTRLPVSFGSELPMTHARALDMVSRSSRNNNSYVHQTPISQVDAERAKLVNSSATINSGSPWPDPAHGSQSQVPRRGSSLQGKPDCVPPDLNVRFQSPGSPASGVMIDSQQPDLALQL